jgi:hypothetical protein
LLIDRLAREDRGDGVEEGQSGGAEAAPYGLRERVGRERTGGHDRWSRRKILQLFAHDPDTWLGLQRTRHVIREQVSIYRQRAAGGNSPPVRDTQQKAAEVPHLGLQDAVRSVQVLRLEGIGADDLGQVIGLVGRRRTGGTHLVQVHAVPQGHKLPRRLGPGETAADHRDPSLVHPDT